MDDVSKEGSTIRAACCSGFLEGSSLLDQNSDPMINATMTAATTGLPHLSNHVGAGAGTTGGGDTCGAGATAGAAGAGGVVEVAPAAGTLAVVGVVVISCLVSFR